MSLEPAQSAQLALLVKRHFAGEYAPVAIDTPATASGFSGAAIYRLETHRGPQCLRRWPPFANPGRIREIHRLVRFLADRIEQIPAPVASRRGETLVEAAGHWWQLEPWVPGSADFHARPTEARLESLMRTLAAVHKAARQFATSPESRSRWVPSVPGLSQTIGERLSLLSQYESRQGAIESAIADERDEGFRLLTNRMHLQFRHHFPDVRRKVTRLLSVQVRIQPALRDVWHDHLLFTEDRLSGLVDFGAARSDTITCDLTRLLGSLFGNDRSGWRRALEIYQRSEQLTDVELQFLEPLDHSGVVLSGMTWLKRRYLERLTLDERRVHERLAGIVERLESWEELGV